LKSLIEIFFPGKFQKPKKFLKFRKFYKTQKSLKTQKTKLNNFSQENLKKPKI